MTVHLHALGALKVSYSDVGEGGGVAMNCEKTKFFSQLPVSRGLSAYFWRLLYSSGNFFGISGV